MSLDSLSSSLKWKHALAMIGIFLSVLVLVLNSTMLVRIAVIKRLRTPNNLLLANLHLADCLLGQAFLVLSVVHIAIVRSLQVNGTHFYDSIQSLLENNSTVLVMGMYMPIATCMVASMLTLTAMTLKKYIHILHPFLYMRVTTRLKWTYPITLVAVWSLAIAVCALPFCLFDMSDSRTRSGSGSTVNDKCRHLMAPRCMFHRLFQFRCLAVLTAVCWICSFVIVALYARIYAFAQSQLSATLKRISDSRYRSGSLARLGDTDSFTSKSN
jgi:hypothetical protein